MRLVWLVILNLSSAPLHNTMAIVGDEGVYVGTIEKGKSVEVELPYKDSCRVIFTLEEEREGWLGTDNLYCDTIKICDATSTFEVEIVAE
jgi:hypothetical protein